MLLTTADTSLSTFEIVKCFFVKKQRNMFVQLLSRDKIRNWEITAKNRNAPGRIRSTTFETILKSKATLARRGSIEINRRKLLRSAMLLREREKTLLILKACPVRTTGSPTEIIGLELFAWNNKVLRDTVMKRYVWRFCRLYGRATSPSFLPIFFERKRHEKKIQGSLN